MGLAIPVLAIAARLVAGAQKASVLLGWTPRFTDLQPILATAWDWQRKIR